MSKESGRHELGSAEGHQQNVLRTERKNPNLEAWFQEYEVEDGNRLFEHCDLIQDTTSDELDTEFIEKQIREFVPKAHITKRFCAKCQELFDHWPFMDNNGTEEDGPAGPHTVAQSYISTFELECSARFGCRFCVFLMQNLKDSKLLETFRKIEARLFQLEETAKLSLSVQNWGSGSTSTIQLLWLNFPGKLCTDYDSGIASRCKFTSAILPISADCFDEPPNALDCLSKWLSTCSESHELCKINDHSVLPTRLLSIVSDSPRLVLTSECIPKLRSLESFLIKIPGEKLPKTFRDAIKITRSVGLDYLWIDSLCIIQDDLDDWERESTLMSAVYGGSTINIAASSARDSSEGCFLKPPNFSGGLRARVSDGPGGRQRVQEFRSPGEYDLSVRKSHLATRAWALQEKLLPPRTVHFGDRGAFWECRKMVASEYLPDGDFGYRICPMICIKVENTWTLSRWVDVLNTFSVAQITFSKDKLPALSGIARVAHNKTGDEYLAGLWRSRIEKELCWHRSEMSSLVNRPMWRAPSWSWASIDGTILLRSWHDSAETATEYAHVLDVSTTARGHDPFGQVSGGLLRLACSTMFNGHLKFLKKGSRSDDVWAVNPSQIGGDMQDNQFPITIDGLDDHLSSLKDSDTRMVYLLPIFSGKTRNFTYNGQESRDNIDELLAEGIVVRATGVMRGEVVRIGSFHYFKNRWGDMDEDKNKLNSRYELFMQMLEDHKNVMATAEALGAEVIENSKYPSERYVVTIV